MQKNRLLRYYLYHVLTHPYLKDASCALGVGFRSYERPNSTADLARGPRAYLIARLRGREA